MKKYIKILKKSRIFTGISEDEIEAMLSCLNTRVRSYKKGEFVLRQGEVISDILVLVEGTLHVQRDDYWGNLSILSHVSAGEMFGEAYIAPESGALMNDVVAVEDSSVMLFDVRRLVTTCPSACPFHSLVVQNMFFAISDKNRRLVGKLGHMSRRTTREKLISYLSEESKKQRSSTFTIPFTRQQLADYLSVDRSAMSNELCKMRDDGLIEFERSKFRLL